MIKEANIIVPRWFLEVVEDTLRIENDINEPDKKKTGESCQDRNIRQSLNGIRKLLSGEELTGMERLEKLRSCILSDVDKAAEEYANYNSQRWHEDGDVYYDYNKIVDAFKAGVKWIEEQGIDAKCINSCNPISESPDIRLHSITLFYEEHEDTPYVIKGDKLKVILRRSNNLARPKRERR